MKCWNCYDIWTHYFFKKIFSIVDCLKNTRMQRKTWGFNSCFGMWQRMQWKVKLIWVLTMFVGKFKKFEWFWNIETIWNTKHLTIILTQTFLKSSIAQIKCWTLRIKWEQFEKWNNLLAFHPSVFQHHYFAS